MHVTVYLTKAHLSNDHDDRTAFQKECPYNSVITVLHSHSAHPCHLPE